MGEIGVYIHIPFCVKKCLYCDFNSFSGKEEYFEEYKNSIVKEIEKFETDRELTVKTIFIGGGTPSVMPAEFICDILNAVGNKFNADKNSEISIEVNPGTADFDKFKSYREMGINRISVGAQSLEDRLLKVLGRVHNSEQFFECAEWAKKAGFSNINFDLMFALPGQTLDEWKKTLSAAVKLNPSHLSLYSLIVEEETPFFEMFESGKLKSVSDDEDRAMYYWAREFLKDFGYFQYEISNFAKKGFECRHNITYWKRKEYLGFGLGACSFFSGKRFHNNYDLLEYIAGSWFGEEEDFSKNDAFSEFMFLGLRMNDGISLKEFYDYFGVELDSVFGNKVELLIEQKLLEEKSGRICLTRKGVDLSNAVFRELLL